MGLDLGAAPASESLRLDLLLPVGLPMAALAIVAQMDRLMRARSAEKSRESEDSRATSITRSANVTDR
jgi:hypothetical protein